MSKEPTIKTAWDRFAISAEVRRRGMTLTGIAVDAGLSESACRQGLLGVNRKGAEAIATALKLPFRLLFPNSYSRGRHREEQAIRNDGSSASQKQHERSDNSQGAGR
ncbi:helix-turn-helix domain-containing protein [Devosia sp.]|uniref:helix-turn-helix domain-containing protein n=1 Tax=Devosia sp. TaxID=1871048 RepID=UPI001AD08A63|nr:helix-turn-helix domain-containing protein [Devosia sp.]MBN9333262.1 helix-turn-helix domain-containing protein [Devosia sp.]